MPKIQLKTVQNSRYWPFKKAEFVYVISTFVVFLSFLGILRGLGFLDDNLNFGRGASASGSGTELTNLPNSDFYVQSLPGTNVSGQIMLNTKLDGTVYLTAELKDGSVTMAKIANGAVNNDKLAPGTIIEYPDGVHHHLKVTKDSIIGWHLADGTITTVKILDRAITTAKLEDGSVTEVKILNGSITGSKIANGVVNIQHLATGAVSTVKIANGAVTNSKLADGSVTTSKIADGSVTAAKIATGSITGTQIANDGTVVKAIVGQNVVNVINNSNGTYTVRLTTSCSDGQVLKWNASLSQWECAGDVGSMVGISLSDLTDIISAISTNGNILMANGSGWQSVAQTNITKLGTVTTGTWNGNPVDISSYTNLAVGSNLSLVGDTLQLAPSVTLDSEWDTEAEIEAHLGGLNFFTTNDGSLADDNLSNNTTSDLPEGANLYYTLARFNSALSSKTTSDLSEGANLYFTSERVDDRVAALIQNGTGLSWSYNDALNTFTGNVSLSSFTTDNLSEGISNLYWTNARFDTRFGVKTTDNLSEGITNLYWTQGRFDSAFGLKNTDNLVEGTTNKYFTDERAQDSVGGSMIDSSTIDFTYNDPGNTITGIVKDASISVSKLDASNSASNGQILSWNSSLSQFEWINVSGGGGGASQLSDLTDVNSTTPTSGNILMADGSSWNSVAQTNITALGTITTGVWNGSPVDISSYTNLAVGSDLSLVGDTLQLASSVTLDNEWDTEAEIEAHLGGLNVFTANDGSLADDNLSNNTTSDLAEGSNLYYTDGRFDTRFGTKTTDNLTEGASNLYWTVARFNTALASKSTTDLAEGTNKYFTDERVDDRVAALIQNGTGLSWSYNDVLNTFTGDVSLSSFTADNLAEGISNLYWTNARFNTAFAAKTTDNLSEGLSNLYWTQSRFDTAFGLKNTDNLAEGSTNKYFTDERAQDSVGGSVADSSTIDFTYNDPGNSLTGDVKDSSITEPKLDVLDTPLGGEVLSWNAGSSKFEWISTGGTGTVTSVASGDGLTGGPITTTGTLSINAPTCSGTDKLQWNGTAFICSADLDTNTTYTPGTALLLTGNQFDVDLLSTGGLTTTTNKLGIKLDGSTLALSASGAKVSDAGITGTQLNTSVAGNGLSGGGGSALGVNVDGSTIVITGDTLQTGSSVSLLGSSIESSEITDGTITNADVSGSAGITESKLALNFATHQQNTDTGTTSTSFIINSSGSGPRIKNVAGTLQVRNNGDSGFADIQAANLQGSSLNVTGNVDFDGLLIAGTSNIQLTNTSGQIQGLSSTYIANLSGANLTSLNASQLTSGTVPSGVVSGSYTGITAVGTLTSLSVTGATSSGSMTVTGSTTLSSMTAGSILFAGTGGVITQDNSNFFWDDTNNRLGVGTATPARTLDVNGAIRLRTLASAPSSPVAGDIYQDGSKIWYYNGSSWIDLTLGGSSSGSSIVFYAEDDSASSTTSTTYVSAFAGTYTPSVTGNYLVQYSMEITNVSSAKTSEAVVKYCTGASPCGVGGTTIGTHIQSAFASGKYTMNGGQKMLSLTGGTTYTFEYQHLTTTNAGGATSQMQNKRLSIIKQ